jgi:gliding motility-associated-like protein
MVTCCVRFFLLLSLVALCYKAQSQNINYQVVLHELRADGDNNDGGLGINDQDPTWFLWLRDNGTTPTSLTAFQTTGCIATTNQFGTWWSGAPTSSGPNIPFNWLTVLDTDATQLITEMEGWEDDCNPKCTYNPSPSLFSACVGNGDDNFDARASSGNINLLTGPPCTFTQYEIQNGDYYARLRVSWEYVSIDPGEINGNQFVCVGGDPGVLGNVASGTAPSSVWVTYQWQIDVGCSGSFVDIPGATNATYDPPLGILQNTCYRRMTVYNCSATPSNVVSVDIETPSTAPTSITANPTVLCGGNTLQLTVNGGVLGTNAEWHWYNGDPNGGGVLLGTGNPLITSLTSNATVYVRAEGNCLITTSATQTITVQNPSSAPTNIGVSQTTICSGDAVNMVAQGGVQGTAALYAWYDTNPTIGTPFPIHTSTNASYNNVSPVVTTTYFVRLEGCDTTAAASVTITVNSLSSAPSGINASAATVCSGSPVVLEVLGGVLGTGANWTWYEGGCGAGAPIGTGNVITVNPTASTTYFVRAQGVCNSTVCASVSVNVNALSVAPVNVIASNSSVCPGGTTTLTVIGGSLGANANWQWYNGSCGGLLVGTGSTILVNPTATTTYYVRAEGSCNTTTCSSITIVVESLSVAPTGAIISNNNICPNAATTLSVSGGTLGTEATWEWYQGSCGGIYVGSGNNLLINPASSATFYVRAQGNCNTTTCQQVTVTVVSPSVQPASVIAAQNSVCPGSSTTLSVNGGTLAPNDVWAWYADGCGAGAAIGFGNMIAVTPLSNTTYYVRAEGPCGFSGCASTTVSLNTISTQPTSVTASNTTLCTGQSAVLNVSGGLLGTGAQWVWYSGGCGGGPVGTGNSISVTPSATTTYFVRGEGACGNSDCASITVDVGAGVPNPTGITIAQNNICPGESTTLTVVGATLPPDYTYVWYTGACSAVPVGVGTTITVSPVATETYYVAAVGTCGATSCSSNTLTVQEGNIAPVSVSASQNNFCKGQSTTLTVNGGSLLPASQWVWYANSCGGTPIGSGPTLTVSPANSSTYYVRGEGGDCGNTSCASVFISIIETIVHTNPYDTICGLAPAFKLNGGEPTGGVYSGNGVMNGDFDPVVAGFGSHTVTYTYISPNGCNESVTTNITVLPTELTGNIFVEQKPCSEGGVTLSVNVKGGSGFIDYFWSDGSYDATLNYAQEGDYWVWLKDAAGCYFLTPTITVTEEMACLEIPNTFTPNNDGKNDTWNLDFSAFNQVKLVVLSKWGREVFTSTESIINWDGTSSSGQLLPAAVYYYVLELDGGERKQSGYITLLR